MLRGIRYGRVFAGMLGRRFAIFECSPRPLRQNRLQIMQILVCNVGWVLLGISDPPGLMPAYFAL